jgi:imidazole glycerol-phosphate synthase subunit HisH
MIVGIIDVGVGNIRSIQNWLDRCVIPWEIILKSDEISQYDLLVLPGVGSAALFMRRLNDRGFATAIKEAFVNGQRIIGICLGAQSFLTHMEEDGGVHGLGLIKGNAPRLASNQSNTGWRPISFDLDQLSKLWLSQRQGSSLKRKLRGRVYYNHNFGIQATEKVFFNTPVNQSDMHMYSSVLHNDNLLGLQFHPEKSQDFGEEFFKMII